VDHPYGYVAGRTFVIPAVAVEKDTVFVFKGGMFERLKIALSSVKLEGKVNVVVTLPDTTKYLLTDVARVGRDWHYSYVIGESLTSSQQYERLVFVAERIEIMSALEMWPCQKT
jgi:hypothetical protein